MVIVPSAVQKLSVIFDRHASHKNNHTPAVDQIIRKAIEANIEGKVALREPYAQLVTIHGVGKILGLTIMLEKGPSTVSTRRATMFPTAGRFQANGSVMI
jgi:hypothetical protein